MKLKLLFIIFLIGQASCLAYVPTLPQELKDDPQVRADGITPLGHIKLGVSFKEFMRELVQDGKAATLYRATQEGNVSTYSINTTYKIGDLAFKPIFCFEDQSGIRRLISTSIDVPEQYMGSLMDYLTSLFGPPVVSPKDKDVALWTHDSNVEALKPGPDKSHIVWITLDASSVSNLIKEIKP